MTFERRAFWKDPASSGIKAQWVVECSPEYYIPLEGVTNLIVDTMSRYAKKSWTILELGCGPGRNLAGLYRAGFRKVSGIEINPKSVELGRLHFPKLERVEITIAAVEDVIKDIEPVDVIFTAGFLLHLPPSLEWVISEIPRKATKLIVLKEPVRRNLDGHAWPHPYQELIEEGGDWQQVEAHSNEAYPGIPKHSWLRVFTPKED